MGMLVYYLQRIFFVVLGYYSEDHTLILQLEDRTLEILVSKSDTVFGKYYGSDVVLSRKASPERIVQIEKQNFLGSPLFKIDAVIDL